MADFKSKWDNANRYAVTVTLASLADGAARQSTEVNVGTEAPLDLALRVKTQGGAAGAVDFVNVYVAGQLGDDIRAGGVGATDAAFTGPVGELFFWGSIPMNGTAAVTVVFESLRSKMGWIPEKLVLVFDNESGAALDATGANHDVDLLGLFVTDV